jgi:N6-L-threonylcarbamoyladenine synthase
MRILGIESSCDETGVGVYDSEAGLLGHTLYSQVQLHAEYGGVVPELASRDHQKRIMTLLDTIMTECSVHPEDLDGIAYTAGPGLAGALMVGAGVACGLAVAYDKPLIPIHHLEGHLLSPLLAPEKPAFPFLALLVSGGHTQLMAVEKVGQYRLLGETLDDAAGEAFDKCAQLLGLGYPGGAALSKLAEQGDARLVSLPRPMLKSNTLDFSFSGLKTAVALRVQQAQDDGVFDDAFKAAIAAAFQETAVEALVRKSKEALKQTGLKDMVVAGGVGANASLRAHMNKMVASMGGKVFFPPMELCTDNGAMIALAGAYRFQDYATRHYRSTIYPRWPLASVLHSLQ